MTTEYEYPKEYMHRDGVYGGTVQLLEGAAETDGLVQFSVYEEPLRVRAPAPAERIQRAIGSLLYRQRFINHRLPLVKGFASEVDAKLSARDRDGRVQGQFNMAKLVCLPAQNPRQELQELAGFFRQLQAICARHPEQRLTLRASTEPAKDSVLAVELRVCFQEPDVAGVEDQLSHELTSIVEQSPALQHFFSQMAVSLKKVGKHAWIGLDTDVLFPDLPGSPHFQHLCKTL